MKFVKPVLTLPVLFTMSLPVFAETVPDSFPPKEATPDIKLILDNPEYSSGFDQIITSWQSKNLIALDGKKFLSGETLTRTITSELATQQIWMRDGASSFNTTLDSVQMDIYGTGIAVGTIVKGAASDKHIGVLVLQEGTKGYDTIIEDRGSLSLRKNAEAYNTLVKTGGTQVLGDYAYAQATIVDGGEQRLMVTSDNAYAEDTIVINGGIQYIWGGTAKNSHISGAGSYQLASGKSIETKVYDGAYQLVYAGSDDNDIADQDSTIYAGGTQRVQAGIADNTKVYGLQIVSSQQGYWRESNKQWEGQNSILNRGQKATNATIYAGGEQRVEWYAYTENTTVDGGLINVNEHGGILNTTVKNGGRVNIAYGGYSSLALDVENGTLTMEGGDVHNWSNNYLGGKGAWANEVSLLSADAQLYIKHNADTTESTATIKTLNSTNGLIHFGSQDGSDAGKFSRLELETLTGSGTIVMNANLNNGQGDFLYVENKIADPDLFTVVVNDSGTNLGDRTHHLISAGQNSLDDSFTLNKARSRADAGAYMVQYELQHSSNGTTNMEDWHLIATGLTITTPTTDAVLAVANVTPTIWDAEQSTLRQRLGELENNTLQNGVWGKYITSRYKVDHDQGANYKQDMNGFVIGFDRAEEKADGTLHVGAMVGYSRSDIDFRRGGDGKVDSYTAGFYGSYIGNSGWYADYVMKYNHFRNKTDAVSTNGDKVTGQYNLSGLGVSFELGKHLEQDNLFAAPYVLISGFYAGSADYTLSNGLKAEIDNASSFKTEVGSVAGYNFTFDGGDFKPYMRLAVNYEFVDRNKVYINDEDSFNNDISGAAVKVGLGATTNLTNGFSAYAEINYMKAKDSSMPYAGNIGIRYSF
ncbi:autotransporter outer membrane beta-barrel domain-containing protein [Zophobihabitans entericus]|uniref:Autotransporter outer membrane beta-barrel domain-containing protein n=1 Tax=Zophobihabitans entericus TaxID=1635327 RepID=A0A6G9IBN0_9GAMM|nr:autotransporter outer membrane beta-barrel domain-containing protein [Zophobihabitans entericus]QIQ21638.1 autotransporter outer membrane beta-barrel domain-containing protein [Zophobihabitans entericus]